MLDWFLIERTASGERNRSYLRLVVTVFAGEGSSCDEPALCQIIQTMNRPGLEEVAAPTRVNRRKEPHDLADCEHLTREQRDVSRWVPHPTSAMAAYRKGLESKVA